MAASASAFLSTFRPAQSGPEYKALLRAHEIRDTRPRVEYERMARRIRDLQTDRHRALCECPSYEAPLWRAHFAAQFGELLREVTRAL